VAHLPILAIDVDGTLNSYRSGWTRADHFPDPPNPGALRALARYLKRFRVAVVSSRFSGLEVPPERAMRSCRRWLARYGFPEDRILVGASTIPAGYVTIVPFRPQAHVTIDDRGWRFTGEWPDPADLLHFEPRVSR
jgi:hypothetical protein